MLMTEQTRDQLNHLIQELFASNAKVDNMVYNLQTLGYSKLAAAIHEPVAHQFGIWADAITDTMIELEARPVRYGLSDQINEYTSVKEIFEDLEHHFNNLRNIVVAILENVELTGDVEIKIMLENLLTNQIQKFRKQANEWNKACSILDSNEFNYHIEDYTHYIRIK